MSETLSALALKLDIYGLAPGKSVSALVYLRELKKRAFLYGDGFNGEVPIRGKLLGEARKLHQTHADQSGFTAIITNEGSKKKPKLTVSFDQPQEPQQ